jgi:predicted ATPase
VESVDTEFQMDTVSGIVVQLSIRGAGGEGNHSLADSGFGYSQVLPILVRGLLSEVGDTFIVEQPELHLNPALQVRLAYFFLAMAFAGKQLILETHSEHIVNTLRVLAAEDPTKRASSLMSIFFLDAQGGKTNVQDISVRSDGTVPRWPNHFFGEARTLAGRLLRAQSGTPNQGLRRGT